MFYHGVNPIDTIELILPTSCQPKQVDSWRIVDLRGRGAKQVYTKAFIDRHIRLLTGHRYGGPSKLSISPCSAIGSYNDLLETVYRAVGILDGVTIRRLDIKIHSDANWERLFRIMRVRLKRTTTAQQLQENGFYVGARSGSSQLAIYDGTRHGRSGSDMEFRLYTEGAARPSLRNLGEGDLSKLIPDVVIYNPDKLPYTTRKQARQIGLHNASKSAMTAGELTAYRLKLAEDVDLTTRLRETISNAWKYWLTDEAISPIYPYDQNSLTVSMQAS